MLSKDIENLADMASWYVEQGGLPDLSYLADMVRILRNLQGQALAMEGATIDDILAQPEVGVSNGSNVVVLDHWRGRKSNKTTGSAL